MIANVEMLELRCLSCKLHGLIELSYSVEPFQDWEMESMKHVLDNLHSTEIRLEGGDKIFLYPSKTYSFQV